MNSNLLLNRLVYGYHLFSIGMGFYGASRGFRASIARINPKGEMKHNNLLIGERLINATLSGVYYSLPIMNFYQLTRLANRLDMKYSGLTPVDRPDQYIEGIGYCTDTL